MRRLTKKLWRPRKKVGRKYGGVDVAALRSAYGQPTTSSLCEVTKPVCIRKKNGKLQNCLSILPESSPIEELQHAYKIMSTKVPDANTCQANEKDCFCLNVDSVWITNINEAVARLKLCFPQNAVTNTLPPPVPTNEQLNTITSVVKNPFTVNNFLVMLIDLFEKRYGQGFIIVAKLRVIKDKISKILGDNDQTEFRKKQEYIADLVKKQALAQQQTAQGLPGPQGSPAVALPEDMQNMDNIIKKITYIFQLGKYVVLEDINNNVTIKNEILAELARIDDFFTLDPSIAGGGKSRKYIYSKTKSRKCRRLFGGRMSDKKLFCLCFLGVTLIGAIASAATLGFGTPLAIAWVASCGVAISTTAVTVIRAKQKEKDEKKEKLAILNEMPEKTRKNEQMYERGMQTMMFTIFYLFMKLSDLEIKEREGNEVFIKGSTMYSYLTEAFAQRWETNLKPKLTEILQKNNYNINLQLIDSCKGGLNMVYINKQVELFKSSFDFVLAQVMACKKLPPSISITN